MYGLEKESAALFLQIDDLLSRYEINDIYSIFPKVPKESLDLLCTLANGSLKDKEEDYQTPLEIGDYIGNIENRAFYFSGRVTFCIKCEDRKLMRSVDAVLRDIKCDKISGKPVNVDIFERDEKVVVAFNGTEVAAPVAKESALLVLLENMIILHYQAEPYLIAIHAGAVGVKNESILFPGSSGAGKSTLTAALASEGFSLYSDEISLVGYDGKLSPLPFCLNIKEGSWNLLAKNYDLLSKESFIRFDGQKVKLVPPKNLARKRAAISAIIFPEFERGSKLSLERISSCETLKRIKEGGYQLDRPLSEESFEKIVTFILGVPAYILKYGSLSDGVGRVRQLIESGTLDG